MARSSIFLMALAASLGFVAAAPVATEQRDIASDPAILAAYDANPKLAAMMGAPSPSKRALESDPAILAAYEANPKLAEMMGSRVSRRASSSNRIKARDETLAPIKVDDGRRNPRLPESIVDENGNGRVLPIVDYDNDGNTVTSWGDVTQMENGDCWYLATLLSMSFVNDQWALDRIRTPGGKRWTDEADVILTPPSGEPFTHTVYTKDLQARWGKWALHDAHWWPAAFENALWAYGNSTGQPNILDDGGFGDQGLTLLTGYESATELNPANYFDLMKNAPKSPVMVGTRKGASKLHESHVYAVLAATVDSNGNQVVNLANPWGKAADSTVAEWSFLDTIIDDIDNVYYLPNHENGPNQS